jgi:hypothetical protein
MPLLVEWYKGTNLSDKPDGYILRYLEAAHSSERLASFHHLHVRHPATHHTHLECLRREQHRYYVTSNNSINFLHDIGVYWLAHLSRIRYLPGSDFGPFSLYLTDMTGRSPLRGRRSTLDCGANEEEEVSILKCSTFLAQQTRRNSTLWSVVIFTFQLIQSTTVPSHSNTFYTVAAEP